MEKASTLVAARVAELAAKAVKKKDGKADNRKLVAKEILDAFKAGDVEELDRTLRAYLDIATEG